MEENFDVEMYSNFEGRHQNIKNLGNLRFHGKKPQENPFFGHAVYSTTRNM